MRFIHRKTGKRRIVQTYPEPIPTYMEGDEHGEARAAIMRANEEERRALVQRMRAQGYDEEGP